jgi:homoserine O-acetyltransferase
MQENTYQYNQQFQLESGESLDAIAIAYCTYGKLNADKSNVIWVCHALTANADVFDWWNGLFGEGFLYNPEEHFIVCANVLGSCYGSTGPLSVSAQTGKPYYSSFPLLTVRDLVKAHILLSEHLGIDKIQMLLGGSVGGQQALEWAIEQPERIENLALIATNAQHSPWGIAFNETQRLAIMADSTYHADTENGGDKGLQAARSVAMLSYRHYDAYHKTQSEDEDSKLHDFKAASYQRYQGEKLVKRFNAYSYVALSHIMDSNNVGRGRGGLKAALQKVKANTKVIAISSDLLFPPSEQKFLTENIPNATYHEIDSIFGHDGFLIETEKLTAILK